MLELKVVLVIFQIFKDFYYFNSFILIQFCYLKSWVLRKFEFSLADASTGDIRASSEIVLKPTDGIHLVVKPRSNKQS